MKTQTDSTTTTTPPPLNIYYTMCAHVHGHKMYLASGDSVGFTLNKKIARRFASYHEAVTFVKHGWAKYMPTYTEKTIENTVTGSVCEIKED